MGGGSSSPPPAPAISTYGGQPNYIPQFQPQNDVSLQNLFQGMQGPAAALPGQVLPQLQSAVGNIVSNPYAPGQQTAANTAGAYLGGTVAPAEAAGASSLQNLSASAAPFASQILQTGFDPQNQLYNRTQQQVQDQLNAQNAMAGLGGTPYGAGVAGQGLSNFNIDWQNNLLNRQNQAAQGYGALLNTLGKGYAGAADLGNLSAQATTAGGTLPYATSVGQSGTQIGGLGALSQGTAGALAPSQQLAGDFGTYLGMGNAASGTTNAGINSAYANALNAFQAQQQANQSMFSNIGGLLGGVSGAFSPTGMFGQGQGMGGAFSSGGLFDLSSLFGSGAGAAGAAGTMTDLLPLLAA